MMAVAGQIVSERQPQESLDMSTIIEFPADAASRRPGSTMDGAPRDGLGTVLILPVVRIEREAGETGDALSPFVFLNELLKQPK